MTTGYRNSSAVDLDSLYLPRVGTAAANVNYKSNGGVDLAQRFQPRGSATPIADTGFRAGGVDLSQIFRPIGSPVGGPFLLHATAGTGIVGWSDGTRQAICTSSTLSPRSNGVYDMPALIFSNTGISATFNMVGATAPPDSNATFLRLNLQGVFSDSGSTVTKSLVRTDATYTTTTGLGQWGWSGLSYRFVAGNDYTLTIDYA